MLDSINFIDLFIKLSAFLIAVIGHEIMHGLVALKYGDTTAKLANRLSINPIKHLDIFGSVILPLTLFLLQSPFLFGWAKPVPVDIGRVIERGGYNAAIFVSLAGITYNICMALLAMILLRIVLSQDIIDGKIFEYFLYFFIVYNVVLAIFNLFPIPPLDGSQALGYLSLKFGSDKIPIFFNSIERYGFIIIMLLLFFCADILMIPIIFVIKLIMLGALI